MSLLRSVIEPDVAAAARPVDRSAPRVLALAAAAPLIAGYAGVAALIALVTALDATGGFSTTGALAAAAPGWLAAFHVPLQLNEHPLGALPLLPTVIVLALAGKAAAGAAHRLAATEPRDAARIVGVLAGAHAVLGVVIAMCCRPPTVAANPELAFFVCGGLSAVAATVGVAKPCRLLDALVARMDAQIAWGLHGAAIGLAALIAGAGLAYTVALLASWPTAAQLFTHTAPGLGAGFGLLLLSIGYLPNAVIGALAFSCGPGFSIGHVSITPFSFTGGPVPAMPVLAAIPARLADWWPAAMALPLIAGALVGWLLRNTAKQPIDRLRSVSVAAGVSALGGLVLAALASGSLGDGVIGSITVRAGLLAVSMFGWIALPGGLVAYFAGPRPKRPSVHAAVDANVDGTPDSTADSTAGSTTDSMAKPDDHDRPEDVYAGEDGEGAAEQDSQPGDDTEPA